MKRTLLIILAAALFTLQLGFVDCVFAKQAVTKNYSSRPTKGGGTASGTYTRGAGSASAQGTVSRGGKTRSVNATGTKQ